MSVQFAESAGSRPSMQELTSFANRAKEIEVGGDDIIELGDDLGINLIANQNRVAQSPKTVKQVSFPSPGPQMNSEIPSIQIRPIDDIEVVNLEAGGASDIRIQHDSSAPFVIRTEGSNPVTPPRMNQEDENQEKQKYLTKLRRLEAQDIRGQRMTMQNTLDEIKAEHDKLVDSRNLEASIRFQRNALMTFVTGVEMVNDKFGHRLPVKPRLKGWSESVHTNLEDFDEIFEELYDMYKDKAKMHPLLRLAGTLGVSATMFHLTNSMAEKSGIPHMADILNEDPELQRQFAQKIAQKMGGGLGNFMSAAMSAPEQSPANFAPPQASGRSPFNVAASSVPVARREMQGPSGVDDIIRAFENERNSADMNVPVNSAHASIFAPTGNTPSSSGSVREGLGGATDPLADFMAQMDDGGSIGSGSTMQTDRRRGRKRAVAPPIGATLDLNV